MRTDNNNVRWIDTLSDGRVVDAAIRNSNGRLSAYGLHCGYIERKQSGKVFTDLWHEGACYHVRQTDMARSLIRVSWEGFDTVAEARDCFGRKAGRLISA